MLSDDQKKMRRTGIGGSEISAIVGLNPYATPIDVWRSKVEGHEVEETGPMRRGRFLEEGVAQWWAHEKGAALREVGTIRHPKEAIVICTPDRLAAMKDGELDLSVKVPGPYALEQWGADGSDEAPDHALLQVQWELIPLGILYGIRRAVITAPVHGELRSYYVEADADIQGGLVEAARKFWRDFVETGTPPPPDSSRSYENWLSARHQNGSAPALAPTPQLTAMVEELRRAKAEKKAAEEKERGAKNRLVSALGTASGVDGLCTYRLTKGKPSTDWTEVCLEVGIPPEVIAKHTTRNPYPALRLSKNGDNSDE